MKAFLNTHKRLLLGVFAALLLLFVWAWFAGQARQQSSFNRTDDRVKQVKSLMNDVSTGTRADRLVALRTMATLKTDGMCHGDWWNDWQQSVVPSIKTEVGECQAKEKTLSTVVRAAHAADRHVTDETTISKQLALLKIDSTAKDWPTKAKKAAESANKALDGIRVVSTAQPVLKAAKARITAIISGWNGLEAASSKQDKNAYITAETQLKQAYADVAAIADVSDEQLQKLLSTLMTAAKPL